MVRSRRPHTDDARIRNHSHNFRLRLQSIQLLGAVQIVLQSSYIKAGNRKKQIGRREPTCRKVSDTNRLLHRSYLCGTGQPAYQINCKLNKSTNTSAVAILKQFKSEGSSTCGNPMRHNKPLTNKTIKKVYNARHNYLAMVTPLLHATNANISSRRLDKIIVLLSIIQMIHKELFLASQFTSKF